MGFGRAGTGSGKGKGRSACGSMKHVTKPASSHDMLILPELREPARIRNASRSHIHDDIVYFLDDLPLFGVEHRRQAAHPGRYERRRVLYGRDRLLCREGTRHRVHLSWTSLRAKRNILSYPCKPSL